MNIKKLSIYGLVLILVQALVGLGIFVTYPQMSAYAATKDSVDKLHIQLDRIEKKLDKLILGY